MKVPQKWVTIGRRGFSVDNIEMLIPWNVSGIRINTGHSSFQWTYDIISRLNSLNYPMNQVLLDIGNTKPRLNMNNMDGIEVDHQMKITIYKNPINIENAVWLNNDDFFKIAQPNDIVYFGDGEMECIIDSVDMSKILLEAITPGKISKGMSIGIKEKDFFHFYISETEINRINELVNEYFISLILSFVEYADDVKWAKNIFPKAAKIIPKIETQRAVSNIDTILTECDTIFIGRGDLALSLGIEKIGVAQKELIEKAHHANCEVALGTGILDSLRTNEIPSRAEIIDITNSCFSGVDYIVLTSETGGSKTPYKAISYLDKTLSYIKGVILNVEH